MAKKRKNLKVVSGTDLLLHRSGKMGRHIPEVKSGCGYHEEKKYVRRKKDYLKGEY